MSPARPPRPEPGPVHIRLRVDDRTPGHTSLSVFIGRTPGALGRSGELVVRNDELEELIADGHLAMDAGPGIYLVPAGLLEDGPEVRLLRAQRDHALYLLDKERRPGSRAEPADEVVVPRAFVQEVAIALEAASEIGGRSLPAHDHLNYTNQDRLVEMAHRLLGMEP